jgi:hypothetical protein
MSKRGRPTLFHRAALAPLVAVALLAGAGCGEDDDGPAPIDKAEREETKAYTTAYRQCKRIGIKVLRENFDVPQPVAIAHRYVEQTTYFEGNEEAARRGCERALGG